jgi:hypothetical protein
MSVRAHPLPLAYLVQVETDLTGCMAWHLQTSLDLLMACMTRGFTIWCLTFDWTVCNTGAAISGLNRVVRVVPGILGVGDLRADLYICRSWFGQYKWTDRGRGSGDQWGHESTFLQVLAFVTRSFFARTCKKSDC